MIYIFKFYNFTKNFIQIIFYIIVLILSLLIQKITMLNLNCSKKIAMLFHLKFKISPSYTKISQIFHLQSRHIIVYLLRMSFSSHEYTSKTICYNFKNLKLCIFWTANNWVTIILFILIFYHYLPNYGRIYGSFLGIEKTYSRFSLMATSSFLIAEFTWLIAFNENVAQKNKALDLMFELSKSCKTELNPNQQQKLVFWFNRAHLFINLYNKLLYSCLAFQLFAIYWLIFKFYYFKKQISVFEFLLYLYLSSSSNFMGYFAFVTGFRFIIDLLFIIGVFKYKLNQCFRLLRFFSFGRLIKKCFLLHCFNIQYSGLHRQLNMYNVFIRKFIYMINIILNVAANITFVIFLSQKSITFNYVGWFIIVSYIFSYCSLQQIFFILAYFPKQNLLIYKTISCNNAYQTLKMQKTSSLIINKTNVLYSLKLNTLIDFLAGNQSTPVNQFGFTNSVFYLVKKLNILDNTFYTIFLLLLFYKRLL